MKADQPPEPKYKEPDDVMVNIKEGKFHIARYGGQTILHIPQHYADSMGKEKIEKIVEEIYTKKVLEKFQGLRNDYTLSYRLELPPQRIIDGKWDSADDRLERLITAIENHSE